MPNFDGTGPNGAGKLSGRGDGPCAGGERRAGRNGCCGKNGRNGGSGRIQGRGFGRGNCYQNLSLEEQEKILEQELASLREARKNEKEA